jgi:hypothetical protein
MKRRERCSILFNAGVIIMITVRTWSAMMRLSAAAVALLAAVFGAGLLSADDCSDRGATGLQYDAHASADNVRMREKPCTQSGSLGFIKIGTPLYCKKKTAVQQQIGGEKAPWFHCGVSDGTSGWVFGGFIKRGAFDRTAHLRSLPPVKHASPLFAKMVNTSWSDCNPAEEANRGCEAMGIGDRTVSFSMISETVYRILEVTEKGKELRLKAELIFSETLADKSSDRVEFVILFGSDPGNITVDGREFYK